MSQSTKRSKDKPRTTPELVGGPATEAVPGLHPENSNPLDPTATPSGTAAGVPREDDGGESLLSGDARETGGKRDQDPDQTRHGTGSG